jgi:beta-xylosidase
VVVHQRSDFVRQCIPLSLALAISMPLSLVARAQDQLFHPGQIWKDDHEVPINAHGGGVLRYEGTYYWFGEHKVAGPSGNKAQVGVHVYSSKDLYGWKDEGVALTVSADPSNDIARGCILERPKVVFNQRTGKFVMWFHLELNNNGYKSARSGVAIADQATGPYRFLSSMRPNAGTWPENLPPERRKPLSAAEQTQLAKYGLGGGPPSGLPFPDDLVCRRDFQGGQMARDMTLFEDDDGKVYHIYSSEQNGTIQISQLDDDDTAGAGRYARILPGQFNEAPAMFKKDGRYFLFTSGTTGWAPNPCRSFSASSIWGPWTYLGNPCRGSEAQTNTTFESQSTWVLAVSGGGAQLVFMADRWRPRNAIDGRYVWLPVRFEKSLPVLEWRETWSLDASKGGVPDGRNGLSP